MRCYLFVPAMLGLAASLVPGAVMASQQPRAPARAVVELVAAAKRHQAGEVIDVAERATSEARTYVIVMIDPNGLRHTLWVDAATLDVSEHD